MMSPARRRHLRHLGWTALPVVAVSSWLVVSAVWAFFSTVAQGDPAAPGAGATLVLEGPALLWLLPATAIIAGVFLDHLPCRVAGLVALLVVAGVAAVWYEGMFLGIAALVAGMTALHEVVQVESARHLPRTS